MDTPPHKRQCLDVDSREISAAPTDACEEGYGKSYKWWLSKAALLHSKDYLKELYPHVRDDDCYMEEESHTYFIRGKKYPRSVSGVWKVFFDEFEGVSVSTRMIQKAQEEGPKNLESSTHNLYQYIVMVKRAPPSSELFWRHVDYAAEVARNRCKATDWGWETFAGDAVRRAVEAYILTNCQKPKRKKTCYFLAACAGCDADQLRCVWEMNGAIESFKGTLLHKRAELYMQEIGAWQLEVGRRHVPLREICLLPDLISRVRRASRVSEALAHMVAHTPATLWNHCATQSYISEETSDLLEIESVEFRQFEEWLSRNPSLSPYRSEWSIFDEDALVAGQVDSLWFDEDGEAASGDDPSVVMADWKRARDPLVPHLPTQSSQAFGEKGRRQCRFAPDYPGPCCAMFNCAYNHYVVQQHLYADFLARKYKVRVDRMLLVQCHPELGNGAGDFNEAHIVEQPELAKHVLAAFSAGWCELLATKADDVGEIIDSPP